MKCTATKKKHKTTRIKPKTKHKIFWWY